MPGTILGQTKISGTVLDNKGLPLPGANVYIKDSYDGATTDTAGVFKFKTTETGAKVLVVSFVGFETIEEKVDLTGEDLT
ncbi:MAG TPA: carboxypeptidase-like regulatory domain-containing protein, partial [Bacteroidetes bacterium]|nr:carboxypeptidase-like regulatory domain-containing protein [Bacteroidota bacterium]